MCYILCKYKKNHAFFSFPFCVTKNFRLHEMKIVSFPIDKWIGKPTWHIMLADRLTLSSRSGFWSPANGVLVNPGLDGGA